MQQIRAEELREIEAKKNVERREVEAYEKQRAEKVGSKKSKRGQHALEKEAISSKCSKNQAVCARRHEGKTRA